MGRYSPNGPILIPFRIGAASMKMTKMCECLALSFSLWFLLIETPIVAVGQASDTTPPVLRSLSFSPTAINTSTGSANVNVGFMVTDDLSGITSILVGFNSPSGAQQVFANWDGHVSGTNPLSVTSSAVASFPKFSESGAWTVWHVALYDAVGNSAYIGPSDLAAKGFPISISNVGRSDTTPPVLTALSFSPTNLTARIVERAPQISPER